MWPFTRFTEKEKEQIANAKLEAKEAERKFRFESKLKAIKNAPEIKLKNAKKRKKKLKIMLTNVVKHAGDMINSNNNDNNSNDNYVMNGLRDDYFSSSFKGNKEI